MPVFVQETPLSIPTGMGRINMNSIPNDGSAKSIEDGVFLVATKKFSPRR